MQPDKDKDQPISHAIRALIAPATSEDYDFSCIAVPAENGQVKRKWEGDDYEYYLEILGTKPENIMVERMDAGLPIFDNHPWDQSAMNTLGVTVGYEFLPEGIRMNCKFGARADEALRADVKAGVIKGVSIEGDIYEYTVERNTGKLPVYRATKWQPSSISFAPVPQDIGAQIDVQRAIKRQLEKIEQPETGKSIIESLISKF